MANPLTPKPLLGLKPPPLFAPAATVGLCDYPFFLVEFGYYMWAPVDNTILDPLFELVRLEIDTGGQLYSRIIRQIDVTPDGHTAGYHEKVYSDSVPLQPGGPYNVALNGKIALGLILRTECSLRVYGNFAPADCFSQRWKPSGGEEVITASFQIRNSAPVRGAT